MLEKVDARGNRQPAEYTAAKFMVRGWEGARLEKRGVH